LAFVSWSLKASSSVFFKLDIFFLSISILDNKTDFLLGLDNEANNNSA
jgi:hypothetical protein